LRRCAAERARRLALGLLAAAAVAAPARAVPCDVELRRPLQFASGSVGGCVTRARLRALVHEKVKVGAPDAYEFLEDAEGRRPRTETCAQYVDAFRRGAQPVTTFDVAMEGFFVSTCGTLYALLAMKPARADHLDPRRPLDPRRLPLMVLPHQAPDEESELRAASARGLAVADYVPGRVRIRKVEARSLLLEYDGMLRRYDLVARGDIDGDGRADLLVSTASYAAGGSLRNYDMLLLARRDRGQALYDVLAPDLHCRYERGRYGCERRTGWRPY
jgi:hypothetical protein